MGHVDFRQLRSLGLVLTAAGVCATAALASPAAAPSRIAFAANRFPLWSGEIYRVDADGTRVDLSNSVGLDLYPVVSPDGKRIVFLSTRGGHAAVYVVGTDGRGLRRVSPLLFTATPNDGLTAQFAWSADGRKVAAAISGSNRGESGLYIADLRGGWRAVVRSASPGVVTSPTWSPDGRLLAYTTSNATVHVVSATGRRLWNEIGLGAAGWSSSDRLAVFSNSYTVRVYDERGRQFALFPGQSLAWSPSGDVAAVMNGKRLQLRRAGVGKPFLDVRIARAIAGSGSGGVTWVGSSKVRIYGGDGWVGYDIAHKRPWVLPAVATVYASVISASGAVAVPNGQGGSGEAALQLLTPGAGSPRVLQTAPWCGDESPFSALQFIPHTQSLIYQSACAQPPADIYAVNPDGSDLRQLTNTTPADETQPSLSPDGSSVVYVHQDVAERCNGCPSTLWRISADGGTPQQLTSHTSDDPTPFDTNPSFSPDGKQIAFLHGGIDAPSTLYTLPASGGVAGSRGVTGYQPVWGPQQIAYFAPTSKLTAKTFDPSSGTTRTVATGAVNVDTGPLAWSSDGRLAYLVYDTQGRASIVTVGSRRKPIALGPLLTSGALVQGLAWSPDGTRFAFTATDADGIGEVYTISTDAKNLTRLTKSIGAVGNLSWR